MSPTQQALVNHCLEIAQEMLVMNGEFHPFGAYTGASGRVQHLGIEVDPKNISSNGEMIEQLQNLATEEKLSEYALCFEVSIQLNAEEPAKDSICVEIAGTSAPKIYQPFVKSDTELEFAEIFAVK